LPRDPANPSAQREKTHDPFLFPPDTQPGEGYCDAGGDWLAVRSGLGRHQANSPYPQPEADLLRLIAVRTAFSKRQPQVRLAQVATELFEFACLKGLSDVFCGSSNENGDLTRILENVVPLDFANDDVEFPPHGMTAASLSRAEHARLNYDSPDLTQRLFGLARQQF
jgi:hypothetical protein